MKITICGYDGHDYFGGPLEWYKRLAPALRDIGVEVDFLFITDHAPKLCGTYMRLKQEGFHCRALRRHSLTQLRDNTEARIRWILRQLRRRPPDLFVANLSVPACFAGRWLREAGIPTACVIHSDDPFYSGLREVFLATEGPFRLNAAVCVSELLQDLVSRAVASGVVVERIPCGTVLPGKRAQWNPDRLRLAYVGRLVEKAKCVSEVARAFSRVTREVKGTEAVIIGDGPARTDVERIVAEHGSAHVKLLGRVDSSVIQDELLKCQVVVLLSDFEGLPISLMEAMACGVVPVCLDIRSGIPELVKHEETGFLVRDRGDDFVAAIGRLKSDSALWERLSINSRQLIESRYSTTAVAQQWKAVSESLALLSGARRGIRVPHRLDLPPVHQDLGRDDRRSKGLLDYSLGQLKRLASRLAMRRTL